MTVPSGVSFGALYPKFLMSKTEFERRCGNPAGRIFKHVAA